MLQMHSVPAKHTPFKQSFTATDDWELSHVLHVPRAQCNHHKAQEGL